MNLIKRNKVFLTYVLSAGSSFFIDLLLFTVFNALFSKFLGYEAIIIATILARILSSFYNFVINSKFVFKKYSKKMLIQYYILVIIQMCLSSALVYLINRFLLDTFATIIKFFVDIVLFIINYFIQKVIIFKWFLWGDSLWN